MNVKIKFMTVMQLILLGVMICSCSNEDSFANSTNPDKEQTDDGDHSGYLLKSVQSEHKATVYHYNGDSSLKSIKEEWNGEIRSESKFIYKNGKVSEKIYQGVFDEYEVKVVIEYKGDMVSKQTFYQDNEVTTILEYFYEDNRMIKQIQKLEWNKEATKQTRAIDIHKVPGKNEIQLKYNGVLSFAITYDDTESPYARIKGYAALYATQLYGITNNILNFKRIYKNGNESSETTELTFDSKRKYLLETIKRGDDQRQICKEIYSYK
jgi:hypothetical protein